MLDWAELYRRLYGMGQYISRVSLDGCGVVDGEDLAQIGLVVALETVQRNARYERAYLLIRARYAMLDAVERERRRRQVDLDAALGLAGAAPVFDEIEQSEMLHRASCGLSACQARVVALRCYADLGWSEIARRTGQSSRQAVHQMFSSAVRQYRRSLSEMNDRRGG